VSLRADHSLAAAIRVLEAEARALGKLAARVDESFSLALDILASCKGKITVTGIGKSGIICKKIAATLSSTGSPAIFLHAADAMHGDLGLLGPHDVVVAVSKSGKTVEILQMLNVLKRLGLPLVALVGDADSLLARQADVALDVGVDEEACPLGLAPTTSAVAAMAMGDALAIALMERKGFRIEDFASVHPGGAIGKKLLRVRELMRRGESVPRVTESTPMTEVIYEMSRKGLGMTTVIAAEGKLVGVISDGDLRRLLQVSAEPLKLLAGQCMTTAPKIIGESELATAALSRMEELKITSLVVVDPDKVVLGVVHIHDLWRTQMF